MVHQLRERRLRLRLTQQRLAYLSNVSLSAVRLMEAGYDAAPPAATERVEDVLAALEASEAEERQAE